MKFSTRRDVDLPAERLFDAAADFHQIERMLVRRGARVQRVDPAHGSPMAWHLAFDFRGREREVNLVVTRFDRPEVLEMRGHSDTFDLMLVATVVALSRSRSRLHLDAEVKPRSMKARLLLQTAKLSKARIDRVFADRFADYVASVTSRTV